MSKLLIVLAFIVIIVGAIYFEKRRGNDMRAAADRLGFSFHPGQHRLPDALDSIGFDLFTQGPPNIKNRMQGQRNGRSISLFDFTYTASSSGEGQRDFPLADDQQGLESRSQSVIWIHSDRMLPDFDLSPARIHKRNVASRFGLSQVTLDGKHEFNQDYILLARDSGRTRKLFSDELIGYLQSHPGLVMESRGGDSLFYRFEKLPDPKSIPGFLGQAEELLDLLQKAL